MSVCDVTFVCFKANSTFRKLSLFVGEKTFNDFPMVFIRSFGGHQINVISEIVSHACKVLSSNVRLTNSLVKVCIAKMFLKQGKECASIAYHCFSAFI